MLKDMMPQFELYQPTDLDGALNLMDRFGENGWALAGGHDTLAWLKDRGKRTPAVIDLEGVPELHGIRETDDGLEIGAMTTLTDMERHPVIRDRFRILADAAGSVATPQIRHSGTIGGNVCQDTRCWYYRSGLTCYRAGGNTCYASAPGAMNREHCIFGASRCVAVSPSDTAPALVALDATMIIRSANGQRNVPAESFFMTPAVDITRMTVLKPDEVLTSIRIPDTWANATFYWEKVSDRNAWDFALINIAAAMKLRGDVIDDIRIACGGVQCVPRRLTAVERAVRGRPRNAELAASAGATAVRGAEALDYNHFKIPLMENLVRRAIRDA